MANLLHLQSQEK